MTELTGLGAFEWLLAGLFALGAVLVVEARTTRADGRRLAGFLLVPALSGLAVCLVLLFGYSDSGRLIVDRIGERSWSVAVALLGLVTAIALADLLLGRVTGLARLLLARLPVEPLRPDLALLLGIAVPVAVALLATPIAERRLPSADGSSGQATARASVRASYPLPGHPMDLVFTTSSEGYISFGEGSLARFELSDDGGLRLTTVATGLRYARGLALHDDTLFVAELGRLPCEHPFPVCKGPEVDRRDHQAGERRIVRTSRGDVLAFRVGADGALTDRRVVVADLPVANTDHGLNDLAVGPDGRIYLAIGNLDLLYGIRPDSPALARPNGELLGTVVSFEPDGSDVEIHARGMRNVYGLAFDDEGRLYGTDNDGPTRGGWRREEVLEIRREGDYGYPADGTFAPYLVPRDPPLWLLDSLGAAGIAWVRGSDGDATLYIGSGGYLDALTLDDDEGRVRVADRADARRLLELPAFVTSLQPIPGGLAAAVWAYDKQSQLFLIDIADG